MGGGTADEDHKTMEEKGKEKKEESPFPNPPSPPPLTYYTSLAPVS